MRTQGEIEAATCKGMTRFEQDYMGRGPKNLQTYLIDDLLVVRLHGVLTIAEQQIGENARSGKGTRPAQASPNPPDRNGSAHLGSHGPRNHRSPGSQPASRHQHGDR